MKYFPTLADDEIRFIIEVIPTADIDEYFNRNPNEFAKIRSGFRVSKAVAKLDVRDLIFKNRKLGSAKVFIEKQISDSLTQIQKDIAKCLNDGDSKIVALLKTLPHSSFVDNIRLYFKLTGDEYTEEILDVIDSSIKIIKEYGTECGRLQTTLNDKIAKINHSEAELESIQKEQCETSKKLSEYLNEIEVLKCANIDLEKCKEVVTSLKQTIESLNHEEQEREDYIQQLSKDLDVVRNEKQQLEQKIRDELAKQQKIERYRNDAPKTPECHKNLEEIKDYPGYNIKTSYKREADMKYLPTLNDGEIRYVCEVIPTENAAKYFKHNHKEFTKICPGCRVDVILKQGACNLLLKYQSREFIKSFIEKHINEWLAQIQKNIDKCLNDGDSKIVALLKTLPYSFFADNIRLYFKLTGEEYTEETFAVIDAGIKFIKESDTECKSLQTTLNEKIAEINRSEAELGRIKKEQRETSEKLSEHLDEIKILNDNLKCANIDLEKYKKTAISLERTIENLKHKEQKHKDSIKQLKINLSVAKKEHLQLGQKMQEELPKQQEIEQYRCDSPKTPKCPKDLDEFKDCLGYNFESIGVPLKEDYCSLLKDHLSKILFQGKPIIISRSTGFSFMRCISNTLVNTPMVSTLAFSSEVTEKSIDSFLSQNKRILCLDNFIGNYNETILLSSCEKHRDKIIFLTVAYDHTLAYIPNELFMYCHYLNLNRIEAFIGEKEPTEVPSIVNEEDMIVSHSASNERWSTITKEILWELGFNGALPAYKSSLIADELCLCKLLAFDILPYCTDVLKIAPFNTSERLNKYAGSTGRCQYKELYRRWFS